MAALRAIRQVQAIGLEWIGRCGGALVSAAGFKVVELPVNHRARLHGVSKYGLANRAFRAAYDLIGVMWITRRRFRYTLKNEGEASGIEGP